MATEFTDDPLHAAIPGREPQATSLDQSDDSATNSLYRAALGAGRVEDYLRVFARFDAADRTSPSWNWAAAVITLNWLAFRQLWGIALAYLGAVVSAVLLLLGIGRLVFQLSSAVETGLLALLAVLAFVVPGMFGNAWLYHHCRKRMERALAANTTLPEACNMLRRQASNRRRLLWLGAINLALGGGTAALAMAVPDLGTLPLQSERMLLARGGPTRSLEPTGNSDNAPAVVSDSGSPVMSASAPTSAPTSASASAPATANTPAASAVLVAAADTDSNRAAQGTVDHETPPTPQPSPPVAGTGTPKPATLASHPAEPTAQPAKSSKKSKAQAHEADTAGAADSRATSTTRAVKVTPATKKSTTAKAARSKVTDTSANEAKPAAASAAAPETDAETQPFVVNVGLFAQENNVRNARAKLQDAGLPVLVKVVKTAKGPLTRVRVGPYATQAEADAVADKIKPLGLDAVVFERPKVR